MAFEFTDRMAMASNLLWAITSAIGAGFCFLVLVVIGIVWMHPVSRCKLDRVSFRIVAYALIANMFFGITSAIGGMLTGPGWGCGFSIFILQLTLQLSSFLLFTIALNLQLVVINNVNGQRMEKFYIGGAVLLSLALTVPPYALGQYGWDPLEQDCWYTNDNPKQRLGWQVGTQIVWTVLTVLGEVGLSISVMLFMVKHNIRRNRLFARGGVSKLYPRSGPTSEIGMTPQVLRATTSRRIIFRIALYPLASCILNLLSIVTVLHSTIAGGIHNRRDYNILLLSDSLYGGRPIVYALLAASDPALIRGVRTLVSHVLYGIHSTSSTSKRASSRTSSNIDPITFRTTTNKATVVHVELTTIRDTDGMDLTDSSALSPSALHTPSTNSFSKVDVEQLATDGENNPPSDPEISDIIKDLPLPQINTTVGRPSGNTSQVDLEANSISTTINNPLSSPTLARRFSWRSATRQTQNGSTNYRREEADFKKQI